MAGGAAELQRELRRRDPGAHLLADRLGLHLTDVSWSGETAAQIVDGQPGRPAQLDSLTATTELVTLTCSGDDVGYIPRLTPASAPRPVGHRDRSTPGRRRLLGPADR
jgi:hypothetical protein